MVGDIGISVEEFGEVARRYERRWRGVVLHACGPDGLEAGRVMGKGGRGRGGRAVRGVVEGDVAAVRQLAIEESLRWGEPAIAAGPGGTLWWAVPLMVNGKVLGGLVASITERRLFGKGERPRLNLKAACTDLREAAEGRNLTNGALLEARRRTYVQEQERAEAIHAYKQDSGYRLRAAYLLDEPALVAAIRRADRREARAIVNRLLVGMIHQGEGRLDLVKSFFMELVVTLCRAAVEIGGAPEELLGTNFAGMSEVARIRDDEELAGWLHRMLERIMDAIERKRRTSRASAASAAMGYIQRHALEDLTREKLAKVVGVSESHLSRSLRSQLGKSFADLVNQVRIGRAAEILTSSDKPLKLVALEVGFQDQSYFTKVFRRHMRSTPAEYRGRNGA